jgi:serine/threonine protein phosphatase PrpC
MDPFPVSLKFKAAAKTDIGLVRHKNQDSFGLDEELGLYVVCDGMGGSVGGEIASELAMQSFLQTAKQELSAMASLNGERNRNSLWRAALAANRAVRMRAQYDTELRGMGTTLVGARLDGEALTVVNIGDSRAYRVRAGEVTQLTADHSYVAESVRRGMMTVEEASRSSMQSVITRAIGAEEDVEPDLFDERVVEGDTILLASDGLTRHVADAEIAEVLGRAEQSAMESCRVLIEMAKDSGGSDNITCLVIRVCDAKMANSGVVMHWR